MSVRKVVWYLVLIPLIAIYLLPLFAPVEPRHRLVVVNFAKLGKYYNFKGNAIWYLYEDGKQSQQPTFLLLHGFPTSSYDFVGLLPQLRRLSSAGSVLAFDFLGFGLSDKPKHHNYTLMEQTDLTVQLLAYLNVSAVHVLSHDYGVSVGQELLARESEGRLGVRILSMTFLNGGLLPGLHRPILMQRVLASHLIGPILSKYAVNYFSFRRSFASIFGANTQPSEDELRVFWAFIVEEDGHLLAHQLLQYMPERRLHKERWVQALKDTKVPLKMIVGPADPVSGRHHADAVQGLLGDKANLSYLDDSIGHYPQVEDMKNVLRLYSEFLSTLSE